MSSSCPVYEKLPENNPSQARRCSSWVDIRATKFHFSSIQSEKIGEAMETRTKRQLKLALWGSVWIALLLTAIFAAFE